MGALHAGHASLIRQAHAENDFVAVSIFVNPTQFGPAEDLTRYPQPFAKDVSLCADLGVDLIFHPGAGTMYPPNYRTYVEVHELQDVLCGPSRPGHFRGVVTVVLKLLNIVQPDRAYFGMKDAQQACIIRQMVHDLLVPVSVKVCPTVREPDGLALSSRNAYLSPEDRRKATVLFQALENVRSRVAAGERRASVLIKEARELIDKVPGTRVDYLSIVDPQTLQPVENLQKSAEGSGAGGTRAGQVLLALAVFIGATRLIDNVILEVEA
jgi:pantoate--beta-alanine ligase